LPIKNERALQKAPMISIQEQDNGLEYLPDPHIEQALSNIKAPKQQGELLGEYEHCKSAACRATMSPPKFPAGLSSSPGCYGLVPLTLT
jgi:hypothetical protein